MGLFHYTKKEKDLNRVMLANQQSAVENYDSLQENHQMLDKAIAESEELLLSLGKGKEVRKIQEKLQENKEPVAFTHKPQLRDWDAITTDARETIKGEVLLEDLLTTEEINRSFAEIRSLEQEFSEKTTIINELDLKFLSFAITLQLSKVALFQIFSKKLGYGSAFDPSTRLAHDDKSIKKAQREANDKFRDQQVAKGHAHGKWTEILYQTPTYDIVKGSKDLGLGLSGNNHRQKTLGHDPLLGWLFGTANILTDTMTLNDFTTYRVARKPMVMTKETIGIVSLFSESAEMIRGDFLNLPAAIFAQGQHLKSDVFTKRGLPVPVVGTFSPEFASDLYKNQYDALCFGRDMAITGGSYVVSIMLDMILGLIHGLFCPEGENRTLFQARTRKILLVSSSIASSSTIAQTMLTKNIKTMDIGTILSTVTRLFSDTKFIQQAKYEFMQSHLDQKLLTELQEVDKLYHSF